MPTTTNYGWTTPADTDLVKDGAAAIRTLGSSIDSTLKTQIDAQIPDALLTTKGDLIAATGASTPARLAVGANGQLLSADSTASTGLAWVAAPSGGGMTQLATGTLSTASVSITVGSTGYRDLYLTVENSYASSSAKLRVTFNNDTAGNYAVEEMTGGTLVNTANLTYLDSPLLASTTANQYINHVFYIPNYNSTISYKMAHFYYAQSQGASRNGGSYGVWASNAAITTLQVKCSAGTWSGGTYTLWGVK